VLRRPAGRCRKRSVQAARRAPVSSSRTRLPNGASLSARADRTLTQTHPRPHPVRSYYAAAARHQDRRTTRGAIDRPHARRHRRAAADPEQAPLPCGENRRRLLQVGQGACGPAARLRRCLHSSRPSFESPLGQTCREPAALILFLVDSSHTMRNIMAALLLEGRRRGTMCSTMIH
jgi:hypothetical protein